MSKRNFKDKVVIITGASGNLGLELCLKFGRVGARIVGLDIGQAALDHLGELLKSEGIEAMVRCCDITDREACKAVMGEAEKQFGKADLLINNAGITHIQRYQKMDKSKGITRRVMEVNFFGSVNCTEAVLDSIVENKGMIINISSVAGFAPLVGRTAYSASKHALHGFFESLRAELVDTGAKVLMVCPSYVGQSDKAYKGGGGESAIHQPKKVLGKIAHPDDIAASIYKAASQEKPLLVVGQTGKISYFLRRFAPARYEAIMTKRLKEEG